eukprot:1158217-Pelagomonas_calceolata.AAC.2
MFRRLFGSSDKGGSSAPPPQPGGQVAKRTIDTIQSLADHEEQLEKRKELLEKRMEAELQKARDYNNQKKKSQALQGHSLGTAPGKSTWVHLEGAQQGLGSPTMLCVRTQDVLAARHDIARS